MKASEVVYGNTFKDRKLDAQKIRTSTAELITIDLNKTENVKSKTYNKHINKRTWSWILLKGKAS